MNSKEFFAKDTKYFIISAFLQNFLSEKFYKVLYKKTIKLIVSMLSNKQEPIYISATTENSSYAIICFT